MYLSTHIDDCSKLRETKNMAASCKSSVTQLWIRKTELESILLGKGKLLSKWDIVTNFFQC